MATAPKLVQSQRALLDPQVKSWIDNIIVPVMVREFFEQSESTPKSAGPVVECFVNKAFSRQGHK